MAGGGVPMEVAGIAPIYDRDWAYYNNVPTFYFDVDLVSCLRNTFKKFFIRLIQIASEFCFISINYDFSLS